MAPHGCGKKVWPEAVNDFWGFANQPNKIRNISVIACKVPERFSDYKEADIHEFLGSHAAEFTNEQLENLMHSVQQKGKKILTLLHGRISVQVLLTAHDSVSLLHQPFHG
jgi:hypothetical protein